MPQFGLNFDAEYVCQIPRENFIFDKINVRKRQRVDVKFSDVQCSSTTYHDISTCSLL